MKLATQRESVTTELRVAGSTGNLEKTLAGGVADTDEVVLVEAGPDREGIVDRKVAIEGLSRVLALGATLMNIREGK